MKPFLGLLFLLGIIYVGSKTTQGNKFFLNRKFNACKEERSQKASPQLNFDIDVFTPNITNQILLK